MRHNLIEEFMKNIKIIRLLKKPSKILFIVVLQTNKAKKLIEAFE
jgi:hypothetical protein